jgi:1-pyrroline-5-carboxylate dehydrogenase
MLDLPLAHPAPTQEPVLDYLPGSKERALLKGALASMAKECPDVPHVIGGKPLLEGESFAVRSPHNHRHVVATCHKADARMAESAVNAALAAAKDWANTSFDTRARIFQRAAELLAGPYRMTLNAATMLGQSKTVIQAEYDSACELVDFLRFNVHYASKLAQQPDQSRGIRNSLELRPLEGFVLAVTPFNFTAIAGNLPAAPALMGNVVVWKPAEDQGLSAYHTMKLFEAAGLPPGVINVVYGDGKLVSDVCLARKELAGVHFTGSTKVFQDIWHAVGERVRSYATYPRLVGETGGKDFVFVHPSADVDAVSVALVRGAYEFQGQKCSAASRAYVPASLWPKIKAQILDHISAIRIGDVADFRTFMGAVINERAYDRLSTWRDRLKADASCTMLADSGWSKEHGWFAGPTLLQVSDPNHPVMHEELFGPVLAVYVYPDAELLPTLRMVDQTSPYALTGALFSTDRSFLDLAARELRQAAGNLYINDKPTGAVVGQQPFGGARASGTNDKAGSPFNLLRWTSPRTVKEAFAPERKTYQYPMMAES